jgi:hypothetical protein
MSAYEHCIPCVLCVLTGMFCSLMTVLPSCVAAAGKGTKRRLGADGRPPLPPAPVLFASTQWRAQENTQQGEAEDTQGGAERQARDGLGYCGTTVSAGSPETASAATKLQNNIRGARSLQRLKLRMDCTDGCLLNYNTHFFGLRTSPLSHSPRSTTLAE